MIRAGSVVTHYKRHWEEGYDQPNEMWSHDLWFVGYCSLCKTELEEVNK